MYTCNLNKFIKWAIDFYRQVFVFEWHPYDKLFMPWLGMGTCLCTKYYMETTGPAPLRWFSNIMILFWHKLNVNKKLTLLKLRLINPDDIVLSFVFGNRCIVPMLYSRILSIQGTAKSFLVTLQLRIELVLDRRISSNRLRIGRWIFTLATLKYIWWQNNITGWLTKLDMANTV